MKLELLERLIAFKDINIIVRSDINPLHYFRMLSGDHFRGYTEVAPDLERWAAVLDDFTRCREPMGKEDILKPEETYFKELSELAQSINVRRKGYKDPEISKVLENLAHECWPHPELRDIGERLAQHEDLLKLDEREIIVNQVLDLAEAYYQRIWSVCSKDEKIVLYRLCTEGGFVGWPNQEIVRRLMHRGLIFATPHFSPINESFRRFVINAELPEVFATWQTEEGASQWAKLKTPLIIMVVILLGFFFATQRDVFEQTLGITAAMAAGAPALIKIFAMLMNSRSVGGSER
jgi:hypothetical protein